MADNTAKYTIAYIVAINIIAIIMTISDKRRAKKNKWRISESSLMTVGFLGGATSMLITMKIIRHKTKHKKFMVGLPIAIVLHIIIILYFVYMLYLHNVPHF